MITIEEVAYHRNGVSGVGFHVVTFLDSEVEGKMVGVVFPLSDQGNGQPQESERTWNGLVAVFNRDMLGRGNITFGENSWRGDRYEQRLRQAIAEREEAESAKWRQKS